MRFERPALFVRGTKSKYVPDEVLPVVGEFFPLFEVVDVDAGHWLISENPEAFRQGEFVLWLTPNPPPPGPFSFPLFSVRRAAKLRWKRLMACCTAVVRFLSPKD